MTHLPVLTSFALTLTMTLFLPTLMEKVRLPRSIGYIVAGIILGPSVLAVLNPEGKTIGFFAELGKLLLMFFAGLDIDIDKFKSAKGKAAFFGLLTFACPFALAIPVGLLTGYSVNACVLIGAMLASHTLLGLPTLKAKGLMNRQSIVVTIGATVFTDMLSILVLAVCLPIHLNGFDATQLLTTLGWLAIYIPGVIFGLGGLAGWMLRALGATKTNSTLVMLIIMAISANVADSIGMEGIIGAFLAGIAVKRALNQVEQEGALEVISQALFIPTFFISAGFLVDFRVAYTTIYEKPWLVIGVITALFGGKWIAAQLSGLVIGYAGADRSMIFSLTLPQVAATLAVALVAYSTKNAAEIRLIDDSMLNATIVLVILSSMIGLILTERAARLLAANESNGNGSNSSPMPGASQSVGMPQALEEGAVGATMNAEAARQIPLPREEHA